MKNPITEDLPVGKNIAKARNAMNLTQEDLAARLQVIGCDITRGTIAKLEVGIRHIKIFELRAIASVLNVSYEYLIDGIENK